MPQNSGMPRGSFASRYLRIFFLAAVVAVGVMVLITYRNTRSFLTASRWVTHTHEVISTLHTIYALVEQVETNQRAYIITGMPDFRRDALATFALVRRELATLDVEISDNPAQRTRSGRLRTAIEAKLQHVHDSIDLYDRSGFEAARKLAMTLAGKRTMENVRAIVNEMESHERMLLQARAARTEREARIGELTLAIGGVTDLILVGSIFYLVIRDRKQSRKISTALTQARDSALRAAEARGQFLANVSHEIRTPMNAILGMTSLLLASDLPEQQRELAETVRSSGESLLEIINEILDFSKIEAGKLLIENTDFDLHKLVESVIDMFGSATQAKGLAFGVLFDHELPDMVRGDGSRIRQVLTNLVGNAIKFTNRGEVIVHVNREEHHDADRVRARFSVTDTGVGIGPELQSRLFQPFSQADASTTRRFGGTGLGLAISKQLVEMMGGELGVDSAAGKGSTFWFVLPLEHVAEEPAMPVTPSLLEGLRVLIVDDNETNRRVVRHNIASWKMIVGESESGADALEKLRSAARAGTPFDLVISDVLMPEMSGVDLARNVRDDATINGARFVMITSMYDRLTQPVMVASGIAACLTKPVKQSALYNAIADAIAGRTVPAAQPRAKASAATRPQRDDVRVLVAEDNRVNQMVTTRFLARLGIAADCAANGAEAVAALEKKRYDLVLMDCHMPEMDGFEATAAIREAERDGARVPIVALTASALEGDRERCLSAGMDDYLSKPLREEALAATLDKWLPPPQKGTSIDGATLDNLRALGSTDEEFLPSLVSMFAADARERLAVLRDAVRSGDVARVVEEAHALKSSSGQIGATRVRALARRLEARAEEGTLEGAGALVEELSAACSDAQATLQGAVR